MKKFILSTVLGFISFMIVGMIFGYFYELIGVMKMFGKTVRPPGTEYFPALLSGALILTLLMAAGYPYFSLNAVWLKKGLVWGTFCGGLAFLSDHIITSGWSVMPPLPMLITGILDVTHTIPVGILVAFFYRNKV
ncbi:MAG: hypothetical protein ACRDEB_05575 [Chitinophagaceae bacterium]